MKTETTVRSYEEYPYICDPCRVSFKKARGLQSHIDKFHKAPIAKDEDCFDGSCESNPNATFIIKAVNNFEEAHVSNKNAEKMIQLWRDGKITAEKALIRIGSLVGPYLSKVKGL